MKERAPLVFRDLASDDLAGPNCALQPGRNVGFGVAGQHVVLLERYSKVGQSELLIGL